MDTPLERAEKTLASLFEGAPAQADEALRALERAIGGCADPARLGAIAAALPRELAGLTPEINLRLLRVAEALVDHGVVAPRDVDALAPALRVAWLRVSLRAGASLGALDELWLLRALEGPEGLAPHAAREPFTLLRRMAGAADPRLRARVCPSLGPAIEHLAISPAQAFACLEALADAEDLHTRRARYRALGQVWLRVLSPAAQATRAGWIAAGLEDHDPVVRAASVALAVALEGRDWLAAAACDERLDEAARGDALAGLGVLANEEDVEYALLLAAADPLAFGASSREHVLAAHRHGAFVREPLLATLLAAYDGHLGWRPEELVRVAHLARRALPAALAELPANDPRWIRRAGILAVSVDVGAQQVIAAQLRACEAPRVAAALIDAAARSPEFDDEAALLAWLERLPEQVIPALRVKGGEAAILRLRELALDERSPAPLRSLAIESLWALTKDRRELMRTLSRRLGPRESGLLDLRRLPAHDDLAASLLLEQPWIEAGLADSLDPLERLTRLCASDEIALLPEVTRCFRQVFRRYVGEALAGDFAVKRQRMPALEQLIYRYGRQLAASGRSVRGWAEAGPEGGRALLLRLVIDWLREDPQPEPAVCVALFETLGRHRPEGVALRMVEDFWRHREVELRRAAIEAIIGGQDEEGGAGREMQAEQARGLERSLASLVAAEEPRLARQALAAVARLEARWAEPLVLAALERPQMAVKKEAAAALARVGSARSVPALLRWISRHDNVGLRERLLAALEAVAGASTLALLVDALAGEPGSEEPVDPRRRALLYDAISGRLTLAAALRLARSPRPTHAALVEAALAGDVGIRGGRDALARALHRENLRPIAAKPEDPAQRLRLEGFSEAGAEVLLAALERGEVERRAVLAVAREAAATWLRWVAELPRERAAKPAGLAIEAAGAEQRELVDGLLTLLESLEPGALEPGILAGFCERCLVGASGTPGQRLRGLALLRAQPPSGRAGELGGLRRYELLAELGGLRTREDLDACLADCRLGPRMASESEALLIRALAIPSADTEADQARERREFGEREAEERAALREGAASWYRKEPAQAREWLDAALRRRPLGLVAPEPTPAPASRPSTPPRTRGQLAELLATLEDEAQLPAQRQRAAERLLAWPDASLVEDSWGRVLAAHLRGAIELESAQLAALVASEAVVIDHWPREEGPRRRARALLPHLSAAAKARLLPLWISDWEAELDGAEALLRDVGQALLLPRAWDRALRGDGALLALLHREERPSLALRALIELVEARDPEAVAHLSPPPPEPELDADAPLTDPLAGKDLDALMATIEERGVELGLAVRAVHALTEQGEGGVDALEALSLDRRPRVRSAALRALRKVASRERSLAAAAAVLEIETRRDVLISLMASLGHGRHQPARSRLIDYLRHREPKLQEAAERALMGWGPTLLPDLRRAARKARPDHRRHIEALIAKLEA
ncbi:HEAT repeat domain-containing protein [Pseudenhygromyxa sp. WMMC2535]|uniref:HEAT repeat domain-containing protein n=1 Tax=Pseudenhygromyxa sp. WMMC2535 TaxID=2712867 RepID=UPI0015555BD1|nr:HEAT repeat domain-containing protein [Pseudenhygromyxa sp. WMMC2535]NVB39871.1 HEAT repeat domain-containing protein [Pseudenhygromyxa sp. WMMC2535]